MLRVEPSNYVRIGRESPPVRTVSPATSTSPSVAATNDAVAPCLTWMSPEMIVTVVAAARARPPKPPPRPNAMNTRRPKTTGPIAFRRRPESVRPLIHATPAGLPTFTTASESGAGVSPAHPPFGGVAGLRGVAGGLVARRRIFRERHEERPGATGLDRERLRERVLREHRDTQSVKPVGAALPERSAHRTHEGSVRHPLTPRQQELCAAPLHVGLVAVGGAEIRERRLRPDARAPREDPSVAAPIGVGVRLFPFRRALRTAERTVGFVKAAPLDDPVLAAVREDHALLHASPRSSQHRIAFCVWRRFS